MYVMSDYRNSDSRDDIRSEEVERYRRERVNNFKLNIDDDFSFEDDMNLDIDTSSRKEYISADSDFTDEISSFSDEDTKAQIERESRKELRRQKKEEDTVRKIKADRNRKVYRMAWLAIVVVLSIIVSEFLVVGVRDFLAISRSDESEVTVKIGAEDSVDKISQNLEDNGVITQSSFFALFANITGKGEEIDPGVYRVPKNKDYLGILNYLRNTSNRQTTITLQITEGTNMIELADQLYEAGVTYDKEEFLRLCNSNEFDDEYDFIGAIGDNPDREYKLEGYMFPDTYEFYADEAPDITIRRFLSNFKTKVYEAEYQVHGYKSLVTLEELIKDSGRSLEDIVVISSLVQAEAANTDDMYNVSSVINNRLDYGSQRDIHSLDLDSTSFYPYRNADAVPDDIKDTFHSKYGTYKTNGLPPGAICSAGAEALIAAAAPNDTNYLYFCHGKNSDGVVTAYYATTFSEHNNNLVKAGLV